MPTYEYACTTCGNRFELFQRFADEPLAICDVCGGSLRKVFHPAGIVLKGSGFYKTDSRKAGVGAGSGGSDGSRSGSDAGSGSKGAGAKGSGSEGSGSGGSGSNGGPGTKGSSSSGSGSTTPSGASSGS